MKDFNLAIYAVKINVPDLKKAREFYNGTLGFPVDVTRSNESTLTLYTNSIKIILSEDKNAKPISEKAYGTLSLTMQVNDIDSSYKKLKEKGIVFLKEEKRKEGVGYSMSIFDPFGNKISILQQTVPGTKAVVEPKIYNCGLYVEDMNEARTFYTNKLGFIERSQEYLPDDMPLGYDDNKFAFMLHNQRKDLPSTKKSNMKLVFKTENIYETLEELKKMKIECKKERNVINVKDGNNISFEIIAE